MIDKQKISMIINSLESINDHKEVLADEAKTVLMDAKKYGFDVSIIKEIIRLRKLKNGEFSQHQSLIDVYMKALEMI
jgi:uncharacterized protein (UPF0335 family)